MLKITPGDLAAAVPLSPTRPVAGPPASRNAKDGRNRMAVASLVVALAGIPLFGVVTGIVAIVLGSIALGSIHGTRQRGTPLAVTAVLLGMADVAGWLVFLSFALSQPMANLGIDDLAPDAEALENLPPHLGRAMHANVMIETGVGGPIRNRGIGSGVIVRVDDGAALIITNRHVIDSRFSVEESNDACRAQDSDRFNVKILGHASLPGIVRWMAPAGIDLALISVPVDDDSIQEARWREEPRLTIGMKVFAIGNPHGLGWTHTEGVISQLRVQDREGWKIHVIQTSTAINPGNSGGGLYDEEGMLIGINTWTNDKRVSEGLSFAITLTSLLDLEPPLLKRPSRTETDEP